MLQAACEGEGENESERERWRRGGVKGSKNMWKCVGERVWFVSIPSGDGVRECARRVCRDKGSDLFWTEGQTNKKWCEKAEELLVLKIDDIGLGNLLRRTPLSLFVFVQFNLWLVSSFRKIERSSSCFWWNVAHCAGSLCPHSHRILLLLQKSVEWVLQQCGRTRGRSDRTRCNREALYRASCVRG